MLVKDSLWFAKMQQATWSMRSAITQEEFVVEERSVGNHAAREGAGSTNCSLCVRSEQLGQM